MRKGKDWCKAWKRRILPGCPPWPLALPRSLSRHWCPTVEPAQHSPVSSATEMPPTLCRPMYPLCSGQRGSGCPSTGRRLWLSLSFRPGLDPPGWPSPSPTQRGQGGGTTAGRAGGSPRWLEPLCGDPRPAVGLGPGRLPAQRSPGGVIFGRGWDARPGGRAPINVPLSPLFSGRQQLGAWTPAPISMETLPRPWEMLPGLSFPPRKRGGREGEETSGSPLPNRGRRHDAREMGTAGGASGLANVPAAQLPAPAGLCHGVPPALWGSLPFPGEAGTQPSALVRCSSLGRTAGRAGSRGVGEERPAATSCCGPSACLPPAPKPRPSLCPVAAGRGLSASPGAEEPPQRLPPLGSQLAPSGTGAQHNKPIDWG